MSNPQIYPQYFSNMNPIHPKMSELVDSGYMLLMPERDPETGCRVVMLRPANLNVEKFASSDYFKLSSLISEVLCDEEETQICGLKFIVDFSNTPLKFFTMFSLSDLKNLASLSQSSLAVRQKGHYVLNLPTYANSVLQFIKSLLSEKLKKRIFFLNDVEELKNHLDVGILPEEYGGKIKVEDATKYLKEQFKENYEMINWLNLMEIDITKESNRNRDSDLDSSTMGSFRKLEID